jgi:hypothetical protein
MKLLITNSLIVQRCRVVRHVAIQQLGMGSLLGLKLNPQHKQSEREVCRNVGGCSIIDNYTVLFILCPNRSKIENIPTKIYVDFYLMEKKVHRDLNSKKYHPLYFTLR